MRRDAPHSDTAYIILDEAKAGNYRTVVVGKRGTSLVRDFVFGSVALKILHHVQDRAVWVVE